jgi:DNA-binding transcriptional ArsR family regulator
MTRGRSKWRLAKAAPVVLAVAGVVVGVRRKRSASGTVGAGAGHAAGPPGPPGIAPIPPAEPVPARAPAAPTITPAPADPAVTMNGADPAAPTESAALLAPVQPATVDAPSATSTAKAKIISALSSDVGLTATEVAEATGVTRSTVSSTLSRMVKTGEVVKADRGYRLP